MAKSSRNHGQSIVRRIATGCGLIFLTYSCIRLQCHCLWIAVDYDCRYNLDSGTIKFRMVLPMPYALAGHCDA
jgi:hypothetical protein